MVSHAAGLSVVVLGGTGSLGRQVCRAFQDAGARVLSVSRSGPADPAESPDHIRLDPARAPGEALAGVLTGAAADVVVNAAGLAGDGTEEQFAAANSRLVDALVEAVASLERRPRLVQLGTVHEYGPVCRGVGITEDLPPAPISPYGRTKLLGAQSVLRATRAGAVDGTVLRIAHVFGPGAPRGSLLGTVAHHLAVRRPAALRLGPLDGRWDFVDIRDVAAAALAAATAPRVVGQVVNIGGGQALGVRRLVERMIVLSGHPVPLVEDPGAGTGFGPGPDWQRVDLSRARLLLGWRPRQRTARSLRDQLAAAGVPERAGAFARAVSPPWAAALERRAAPERRGARERKGARERRDTTDRRGAPGWADPAGRAGGPGRVAVEGP
ncbi:NAD-dependent epimerase/dehydratase family protein [Streptomyces coffeae]|uniref:NAD-dependent epimerase/dehydratase family protein n=1 Tax=Streptomyces coffeae TaxID=621382 RepID=A0ABS1ND08_9ACTN|nr:NAD-dependent epimerase/dehydratase family protein [Streptomyces coffeae]MBL1097982.1 NAD-dependent epimerase/dehydratase family protein [Streptomyces coffeae]